ncbi:uncharacterized protein LOC113859396 [Abrus precatorius]|uniref:Uncharacterized protein LOC113859396 n=1 Tax=Abrus precatorius TaxID=3816 RepID=A0A8B8L025_ABRPR|nr:uncharacterized protein LOC113859396 [Abrus precatorius]
MAKVGEASGPGNNNQKNPRRLLGEYSQQLGSRYFSSIVRPVKGVEMKPALLSLITSNQFARMDHENPYNNLTTFYELKSKNLAAISSKSKFNPVGGCGKKVPSVPSQPKRLSHKEPMSLCVKHDALMKDSEEAITIIDALAASDFQAHHDRSNPLPPKRRVLELDTQNVNPNKHCKSITTRKGTVIGKGIGDILNQEVEERGKKKKKDKEVVKVPPMKNLPYPHAPSKKDKERQFTRFLDILKRLQINIFFTEAMEQMPTYAKFMKELLTQKKRLSEKETVKLEVGRSAIIQRSLPQKSKDPGSFTLPVTIGQLATGKALLYLGASISLMPLSMLKRIGDVEVRLIRMTLHLIDRSVKYLYGIVEDLLVKDDKFMFLVDFVVMDMEEDSEV